MQLQAGFLFRVAPRFHNRLPWSHRLQINGGVECSAQRFFPRNDWRKLSPGELALLIDECPQSAATARAPTLDTMLSPSRAGLLAIPSHLRASWWTVAERADTSNGRMEGYESFVAQLLEFLRFKRLPLPEHCGFDVVASRPSQRSTHLDAAGESVMGLGFNTLLQGESRHASRLVGAINLGDEATHLVLLNLSPPAMCSILVRQGQTEITATSSPELLKQFFAALPDYPLVRLRLDPGEGLWLPNDAVVYDRDTQGKQDLDLVLTIRTTTLD